MTECGSASQTQQAQDQFTPLFWGPRLQPVFLKAALEKVAPKEILGQLLDAQARGAPPT